MAEFRRVTVIPAGGGDYTSLNTAFATEDDTYANLTAQAGWLTFECRNGADATTCTTGTGWTTDATHYLRVEGYAADNTSTNTGKWSTERYRLTGTGNPMLSILEAYTQVVHLQISTTGAVTVNQGASNILLDRGIITGAGNYGIYLEGGFVNCVTQNCLVYNKGRDGYNCTSSTLGTNYYYNCTAVDCGRNGFDSVGSSASRTMLCTDCLGYHNGDNSTYFDFEVTSGTLTLSNCASMDNSATGTDPHTGIANPFDDSGTTNYDADNFHLSANGGMVNAGTDTYSLGVTTDIDSDTLSVRNDIGCDEYVAAGGGTGIVRQMMAHHGV